MIAFHLTLFAAVVIFTAACLFARGGRTGRPVWKALLAALPPWMVGATCMLGLSARGAPLAEWIVPTVGALLIGLFCRSETLFKVSRWVLPVGALALCGSFLTLTAGDYTAAPETTRKMISRSGGSVVREWHTPVTRLYRIERKV